tara:strand:+ start:287 stop:508 length:222 start_codon:yes stop_codon:yes gene_type:complete
MKVDQDWWKTWFKRLEKDGHHNLLQLYNKLKEKNPREFHLLMDEIWRVNYGTVVNYNKSKHQEFVKAQMDLFE